VHELQETFMKGGAEVVASGEKEDGDGKEKKEEYRETREGKWESGAGRCAVSGRRVLGGVGGLRRVLV